MADELVGTASGETGPQDGDRRVVPIGTVRVDLSLRENKTFDATFRNEETSFGFPVDEPSIRGGDSNGPTPLGYFVAGAASCLAMQYASLIKEQSLPVEGVKMLARAHHDRERRVFKDMVYKVELTGTISVGDAEALADAASKRCYVENTLTAAIPITTDVFLNGEKVTTVSRHP